MFGAAQLEQDLAALGLAPETVNAGGLPHVLLREYQVESGPFAGRVVDVALPVPPDYPNNLGRMVYVRATPHLLPFGSGQGKNNYNVLANHCPLGPEWQYWSFDFSSKWQQGRGLKLDVLLRGVFDHAE